MNHTDPDQRLTVREVTKRYFQGYTERYVRELARRGEFGKRLPRLGKGWMIPVSAVKAFFDRNTVAVNSNPAQAAHPEAYKRRVAHLVQFRN